MKKHKLWFYDFEVFTKANWWMVVFIDYDTKEEVIILNNKKELEDFYSKNRDEIFIGYNSRGYDQWILKSILLNKSPFEMTEGIIEKGKQPYQMLKEGENVKLNNFDISNAMNSLKQLEGFMGSMIKESSVPFDLDRPLTQDEIEETIRYCRHDVQETIKVFEYKREDFDSQLLLIDTFDLDMGMFNKTKAQLSAHILGTVKQSSIDDEFDFVFPKTLRLEKYKYIYDWYKNPRNLTYKRKLEVEVAGCPTTFAYGGVHGAKPNCFREGIILCFDVASLYPSIMILYDCLSRNVLEPKKYEEIKRKRLEFKKLKDKKQAALKLVLNATYGILKDINNAFYDPRMSNQVCVTGQLLLLDLVEKVEHLGETLQMNTDGVYMYVESMEKVEEIKELCKEWETRTGLELEFDIYAKIFQRDVNNYIIVDANGKYKSKGCVKKKSPIDNDLPIITDAIINYCVNNTPVEDTINNCDELIKFQKIVKVSSLYKKAFYGTVKQIDYNGGKATVTEEGEYLPEKVLRVFASNEEHAKGIYKIKNEYKVEKIANTPDKCFINNENIINVKCPEILDKQYYIDMANDRLQDFLGANDKKSKKSTEEQVLEVINKKYLNFYDVLVYIKNNTKLTNTALTKYIKADIFKQYGTVNKILNYMELFKGLYNKKSITQKAIDKLTKDDGIVALIQSYGEFNDKKNSYTNYKFEESLKMIFKYLPENDIPIGEKVRQEFELFDDCSIHSDDIASSVLFVMNVNQTKNPTIIAYSVKTGITNILKVPKEIFTILDIREGDFIKALSYDNKPKVKVIGKSEQGINLLGDSETTEWWLTQYEIIDRDYKKNNKSVLDCEMEVI